MHWYGGTIAEAVTLSKQRNAIFVVFVEGENELSSEMTSVLDDAAVLQRLGNSTNFLAIRLKSGSTDYTHFAQIYQFVPVPSLFFIGRNGTPLEVVCAGVQPANLASRIDRILEEHYKDKPALPSTVKEQTVNLLASESTTPTAGGSKPTTTTEKEDGSGPAAKVAKLDDQEVVCNDGVCIRRPRADGAGPSKAPSTDPQKEAEAKLEASESTVSTEEKMERAKALIEAKRKEKAEKEKQLEKEKEKERRNVGQGVAELKKWQADQELKQLQEERKREKMENNLARQRILEQIAQDRAEQRARDTPATQQECTRNQAPATSGDGGLQARVQFKLPDGTTHTNLFPADARLAEVHRYVADHLDFKLPDGTTHTNLFPADARLAEVHRYVADHLDLPTAQFSLWLAFPRRELTDTDATLRRLELAPSAALLVLPRRATTAVTRPSSVGSVIAFVSQLLSTMIYQPSVRLYTWLVSLVSPAPGGAAPAPSPGGAAPSPGGAAPDAAPAPAPAAGVRKRTNVHRLQGDRPDDDNNTWNGNSTQQM